MRRRLRRLIHRWRCRRAYAAGIRDEQAARELRLAPLLREVAGP